jgi:DNA (cytosine-5)-methyltransferase 1
MRHGSLFSGIGGFDLAAEWMGWTNVFNCEWEEFPRQVLKHHFPHATQHQDIREFDATAYAGRIDIISGGFPCQPYSTAGKRKGKDDERHLWPEMLRVIQECAPTYVVGENVRGLISWNGGMVFEEVCADLEAQGYTVQPFVLPAAGVGAPHRRDRVWFVAYSNDNRAERTSRQDESKGRSQGLQERYQVQQPDKSNTVRQFSTDTDGIRIERQQADSRTSKSMGQRRPTSAQIRDAKHVAKWQGFPTVAAVCGGDDGLSKELDGITFSKWRRESIKAYGNAIVPQVALQIFRAIEQYELSL